MKTVTKTAAGLAAFDKPQSDGVSTLQVSGAYTGLSFKVQQSLDGTNFFNVGCIDKSTGAWIPGGTAITPVNGSVAGYTVPSENCSAIQANITAVTGSVDVGHQSSAGPVGFEIESSAAVAIPAVQQQYAAVAGNTPATLTGAQMAGANSVNVEMTAALAGAGTLNSATAAQIVAATPNAIVGQSYKLRIINTSSGNFAWTLTTATGITLTGTMSIAQNTYRDFIVTLTSLTAVSIRNVGSGAI